MSEKGKLPAVLEILPTELNTSQKLLLFPGVPLFPYKTKQNNFHIYSSS